MKKWMIWMLSGSMILFGGVFGFWGFKQVMISRYLASMPVAAVPVTAIKVQASNWTPVISAIGFIEPKRGVMLSASVSGLVSEVLFESGQPVEAGTLLLRLDADKERADLRSAESRLPSVRSERNRLRKLLRQKLVSQEQADSSAAEYQSLLAQIDSLKATIARREIRAPFAGVTGILQVQPGQYLQAGSEIVRVENIDVMRIRFIVGEQDYARISVGTPIQVKLGAYPDRVFDGAISAIEPAVDYQSGVVQLQASIPNSDRLLRSGMYAEVEIHQTELAQQIVIPQSAINFTLYGETVYRLEPDPTAKGSEGESYEVAKLQTVKVAERRGSLALVSEGIQAGDQIVTSGQLKLSNDTRVKVVNDTTLAPPAELPRR